MEPIVKQLDHEFAKDAKLSLEIPEGMEGETGLKPLPSKIKYEAIKLALEELKTTLNCDVNIAEGEFISTAYIDIKEYRKSKNIKIMDQKGLDKLNDNVVMELLRLTQNNIRKLLTEMDENFRDYYRSDAFFESTRNDESIIINWSRPNNEFK